MFNKERDIFVFMPDTRPLQRAQSKTMGSAKMKSEMKLILGALILLALIGSARAVELPKEILGVWCGDGSAENLPWGSSNDQRSSQCSHFPLRTWRG
jgi:hypothetical protein